MPEEQAISTVPAESAGASHSPAEPATSPSTVSGDAVTAPAPSPEREAIERLRNGESPYDIQRDLHERANGKPPVKSEGQTPQPDAKADDAADADHGLTEKELAALKRGKFDLGVLKHMPEANRKAIARAMAASQAESDRQYQLAKAGKKPDAKPDAKAAEASDEAAEVAGNEEPTEIPQEEAPDGKPTDGKQAAAPSQDGAGLAGLFQPYQMDPKDFQTLVDIGGDAFAEAQQGREAALVRHVQQSIQPLAQIAINLANLVERNEFDSALKDLKSDPAFKDLGDKETTALKDKARLLIRAAGDPSNYRYGEALKDAAASLFKPNVQRQAQADLARKRSASLAASPDKGDGRKGGAPQRSEGDTMRAIARYLMENPGADPHRARQFVEAAA